MQNGYESYRQVGTVTADPVTLTSMLYEGALKAIRRARLFGAQENHQKFYDETQRAHLILGELLATLDMEQGEIPRNLAAVYAYCIRCLVQSTVSAPGPLDEAERHIAKIADAWKTATSLLAASVTGEADAVA